MLHPIAIEPSPTLILPSTADTKSPPNLLFHEDNRAVMERLLSEYEGKLDLIYADPPFAVGSDFTMKVIPGGERINGDRGIEVLAYRDRWGSGADGYEAMMRPRLELMYRLLSPRGALWLHCDYRTNHRFRVMLYDIFGQPMVNEIIWAYGAGGNPTSSFPRKHDHLLVYSKSGRILLNKQEPIMRIPYDESTLTTHYRSVDQDGRRYRAQIKNGKEYRTYADQGKLVTDVWTDIGGQPATSPISKETTGYASQKPEKLIERIIGGTTEFDWLVADFFCGSGTVGAVASRLGRRWLMSDASPSAIHAATLRLLRERKEQRPHYSIRIEQTETPSQYRGSKLDIPQLHVDDLSLTADRENANMVLRLDNIAISIVAATAGQRSAIETLIGTDPRHLIDYWAVCLDENDADTFTVDAVAVRSKKDRALPHTITLPHRQSVRIRFVTIFGQAFDFRLSM